MSDAQGWTPSRWFLLTYDRSDGRVVVQEFEDEQVAFKEYLVSERRAEVRSSAWEVVLIGADSVEDVRASYPHYFTEGTREQRMQRAIEQLVS